MKERELNFKVYLPQLESDPGKYKGGVKRYQLYKNEDSPALILGGSLLNSSINASSFNNLSMTSSTIDNLKRDNTEIKRNIPQPIYSDSIRYESPKYDSSRYESPKYIRKDTKNNNMLELSLHPAFKQPNYTKQTPKMFNNNPITGYTITHPRSLSPEKRTNLIEIGSRLVAKNKFKG